MLIPLTEFAPEREHHNLTLDEINSLVDQIEENYRVEIAKIQSNFAIFDDDYFHTFKRYEDDFQAAIAYIEDEYKLLYDALQSDFQDNEQKQSRSLQLEISDYTSVLSTFKSLQNQANQKYLELCKTSEAYIDRESSIHSQFVAEEESRFEEIRKTYGGINNKQYDTLLWSMEKSKNALNDISKKLNEQAFNDSKFLTGSVIKSIEELRDAKNNITMLFKTTTQIFSQKKRIIDDLSLVRQKPHSVLNQKLINQFIEQIHSVNEKRSTFERVVNEDLHRSISIIGQKMIDSDLAGDQKLTRKYIMQYQIVKAKSAFLLKRNNEMSDLLISKYQNEIKKIKIDSFRRVEEIKLAYYMPSEFFQNSITLYSNFAFYINESMDDIDNLLSDFIRFNQNITQTAADYIHTSSKIFEDYKINLLVTVNDATNRLTDLITNVDRISKEIIQLESKNRLEIAEVRKEMENSDITGDYQKYLKTLDFDNFFANHQHEINLKKIASFAEKTHQLLTIQSKLTDLNKEKRIEEIAQKQTKLLNTFERQIHESAIDKEYMLSEAKHRKTLSIIDAERKIQLENTLMDSKRQAYLFGKAIEIEETAYRQTESEGNFFIVDYVHETQKLIDLHKRQTDFAKAYVNSNDDKLRYARVLENERRNLIQAIDAHHYQTAEPYRRAVSFYSHLLYMTHKHLVIRSNKIELIFKQLLSNLNDNTTPIQASALESSSLYKYDLIYALDSSKATLVNILATCSQSDAVSPTSNRMEELIYRFSKASTDAEEQIIGSKKPVRLQSAIRRYYIETILIIKEYTTFLGQLFPKILEKAIESDVLIIDRHLVKRNGQKEIINREYEERIYEASRRRDKKWKIPEDLDKEYADFELIMKERVYQLNVTFLDVLNSEKKKLDFIKQELLKCVSSAEDVHDANTGNIDKKFAKNIKAAQTNFLEIENNYKIIKAALFAQAEAENLAADQESVLNETERQSQLKRLNQSIAVLPNNELMTLEKMEAAKSVMMEEKKALLNKQLAEIEEHKLLSTPIFLEKIEIIKSRLPNDYVTLYKEISEAEMNLVKEHRNIEITYQQNFGHFINNQMEFNSVLFNDAVIMHPFDKNLATTKAVIKKSNELFKDTLDKSSMAQDLLNKKTTESNEKQKRVLNV